MQWLDESPPLDPMALGAHSGKTQIQEGWVERIQANIDAGRCATQTVPQIILIDLHGG